MVANAVRFRARGQKINRIACEDYIVTNETGGRIFVRTMMWVILIQDRDPEDGRAYWSLTLGEQYEVIGIEADSYRIVDDTGDPVLFHPECFEITDSAEPEFWEVSIGDDGERYAYPPAWDKPGFFEDYHDAVEEVRRRFWQEHRRLYGEPRPPTKPPDAWRVIQ